MPTLPAPKSTSILHGVALTVAMRWTDRLIGLVSTLILARLLAPEDFGIIAMASLVISLADALLDMGVHVSLIQNRAATQAHYNSAWTMKIIQSALVALILVLGAPFAATYFQNEEVVPVIYALSFSLFIAGFENIGIVQYQKDMQFQREFYFRLYRRVFSFLVTILAAWWLKSYWALVIGTLAMRGSGVVLSYIMHSMRPRWGTSKFREIFSVSQWMLVGNIAAFLEKRLHLLMVGRWSPVAIMGGYTLADEVSEMPSGELLAPINRVLFPAFAKAAEDPIELKRLFILAQSLQNFVALPAAIGLMMVASEVVGVALGDKWAFATPFLQILALVNIGSALVSSSGYVLIVLKKVHLTVVSKLLSVSMFGLLTFLFFRGADAMAFAFLKLGTTILFSIGIQFWLLKRHLVGLRHRDLLLTFLRPAVACGVMAAGLHLISSHLLVPQGIALLIKVVAGAALYGVAAIALWVLAGRPKGAESFVLDHLRVRFKRL